MAYINDASKLLTAAVLMTVVVESELRPKHIGSQFGNECFSAARQVRGICRNNVVARRALLPLATGKKKDFLAVLSFEMKKVSGI